MHRNNATDTLSSEAEVFGGHEEAHFHEEAASGLIKYTKEQAWKSRFNVIRVEPQEFTQVIRASGELESVPGEKQFVVAKAEGIVFFTAADIVQGKYVKKGEGLFTLSGEGLAENNVTARFSIARANFEKSKSDLERHKSLLGDSIISEKQFLETNSRYISDSILFYSLKETVTSSGMMVLSPMDGSLHELNVSEGQYVKPGDILATLSSDKVLLLRADVPQQYFHLTKDVVTANFRPAYSEKVYTLEEMEGRLISRGASVAENNHYLPIYFVVVNDGTLVEGAFAEFYLKTKPEPGHIVVPATSLIEEQGNYYVYVQVSGEAFEKRAVTLLFNDGLHASIKSGLDLGERIVHEGAMLIKAASTGSIPSHDHAH